MSKQSVAHLDGFVSTVDTDVHMEAEDDQSTCDILHRLHEPLVALAGGQQLITPVAGGMGATPQKRLPIRLCDVIAPFELLGEVCSDILDGIAHSGVEFAVGLHDLVLDCVIPFFWTSIKDAINLVREFKGVAIDETEFDLDTDGVRR